PPVAGPPRPGRPLARGKGPPGPPGRRWGTGRPVGAGNWSVWGGWLPRMLAGRHRMVTRVRVGFSRAEGGRRGGGDDRGATGGRGGRGGAGDGRGGAAEGPGRDSDDRTHADDRDGRTGGGPGPVTRPPPGPDRVPETSPPHPAGVPARPGGRHPGRGRRGVRV